MDSELSAQILRVKPGSPERTRERENNAAGRGDEGKGKGRCLKMAKASHERQRLFLRHFGASENRVQEKRNHSIIPRYRKVVVPSTHTNF